MFLLGQHITQTTGSILNIQGVKNMAHSSWRVLEFRGRAGHCSPTVNMVSGSKASNSLVKPCSSLVPLFPPQEAGLDLACRSPEISIQPKGLNKFDTPTQWYLYFLDHLTWMFLSYNCLVWDTVI